MRKVVCLLGLVFLFSLSAAAQDVPKVDLFAGYSYVHTEPWHRSSLRLTPMAESVPWR